MNNKIRPIWYLLMGIVAMTLTHLTYGIGTMAWVASVPFLMYLRVSQGLKSRLLFALALVVAWSGCVAKIVSPPMPYLMVFLFSVPIALFHLPGYLLWDRFKKQRWSLFLFPATMVTMEWIQYTFTPFASWGVAAYTQSHSIVLMQAVSLFGLAGLGFLVYWVNVSIAEILVTRKTSFLTTQLPVSILLILIVFGALRYGISKSKGTDTMAVAAVGTDSAVAGLPLPSKESNGRVKATLFERTRKAAQSGAKLVVWNEASTFILPEEEAVWFDSLRSLASMLKTPIVAAYVMPVSQTPLQYENKYLFVDSSGAIGYTYNKHQPVPGEPAAKGKEPLKVLEVAGAKVGAAICYDYDFPYLANGFGQLKADLVALPSSDWRGIDPIHTEMAAFRAVEQGHSVLRSTRFGLSAAITPYGEMSAQMSSFDHNDKIMMAHLPVKRVFTVYAVVGDLFVYLCMGFVVFFLVAWVLRWREAV